MKSYDFYFIRIMDLDPTSSLDMICSLLLSGQTRQIELTEEWGHHLELSPSGNLIESDVHSIVSYGSVHPQLIRAQHLLRFI